MKNRITKIMGKFGQDKVIHFLVGTYVFLFSLAISIVIGGLIELVHDSLLKKGTPEWLDFIATFLGALIPFLIIQYN